MSDRDPFESPATLAQWWQARSDTTRRRTRKFGKGLSWIALVVLAIAAFWWWRGYGWRPDLRVSGQVIDRESRKPVADAWVILALASSRGNWAHGATGCSRGSAVVRSDRNGRFSYRIAAKDAFRKPYPDSSAFEIYAHHPRYVPPTNDAYMGVLPVQPNGDDAVIQLIRDKDGTGVERSPPIELFYERWCLMTGFDHGQITFISNLYREQWDAFCAPQSKGYRSTLRLHQAIALFEGTLGLLAAFPVTPEGSRRLSYMERRLAAFNEQVPRHVWDPSNSAYVDRPPTPVERAATCALYSPPADRLLSPGVPP